MRVGLCTLDGSRPGGSNQINKHAQLDFRARVRARNYLRAILINMETIRISNPRPLV